MARNKSPGVSGFSPEFLLHFWSDIGPLIVQYINQSRNEGLFITHRRGIITLIPKKGDQRLLKNKRPVCLLDVTYKLIAKIVSIRISTVIDGLVERTQTVMQHRRRRMQHSWASHWRKYSVNAGHH